MLEDYISRIETIISPNHYSRENFKEKLQIDGSKIPKDFGAVQEDEEEEREEEDKNPEIEENQEQKESPLDQEGKEFPTEEEQKEEQKEAKTPKKALPKTVKQPKGSSKKGKTITSSAAKLKQKSSKETEEEGEEQSVASENQELSKRASLREYNQLELKQLLDKVHNLNKKNMNYRYDIEKLKTRIQILENEKKEQAEAMEKVEKQKSQLSQYLVRLEKTLNKQDNTMREFKPPVEKYESPSTTFKKTMAKPRVTYGVNPPNSTLKNMKKSTESSNNLDNSKLNETKSTLSIFNSPTVAIDIGGNNVITIKDTTTNKSVTLRDKADQKNFLLKIAKENQKLKEFQSKVFELSKTYDDINDNILASMKNLENLLENKNKEANENQQQEGEEEEENLQPPTPAYQQEMFDKFQELLVDAENVYNPNPEEEEKKEGEEEKKEGDEEQKEEEKSPEEKLEAKKEEITDKFQEYVKSIEATLNAKQQEYQKQLVEQYQSLVENVEKIMQTKQEEYNKLLKTKDEQIEILTNEITSLRTDIEARKKDRIKDLHIISTLEEDNKNLKDSLLKGDVGEVAKGKNKDLLYNLNEASMGTLKPKTADSRVEPMKKMLGSIVERIEANFDLNDRDNVQMIETLHKTLK